MKTLSNLKKAGRLRQLTSLEPVTMNATRWSSKFTMVERFFRLEEFIKTMDDIDLNVLLPSGKDYEELKQIRIQMEDFENVTRHLQDPKITVLDSRLIFDEVINDYPSMAHYLAEDSQIVKNLEFITGVCKVLGNNQDSLTDEEKNYLAQFSSDEETVAIVGKDRESIVQRALKRRRTESNSYKDLAFITPTSNVCERLFSAARFQ